MSPTHARRTIADPVVPPWRRWWPLAQQEAGRLFRSGWGVAVFCICLLPVVVKLFVLMVWFGVVDFGRMRASMMARPEALARWNPLEADFYVDTVVRTFPGLPLFVLLTATATAGAVARDRSTHALELLWTRGITPMGYLMARWVGASLLLALVTVAGPLLLWICAVLFAEDWSLLATTGGFVPGVLGGLLIVTLLWSGLCVLVSALSASTGQAIVAWCLLMVGSSGVANVMAEVFREPVVRSWLSVWDAGGILARALAGVPTRGAPWPPAAFVLMGALLVLTLLVRRRLVVSEAVA